MTGHSEPVRWAVLNLRVAPQGDFKIKTVTHAEWHFKLACCSRAAQGCRQSSDTTRLLIYLVPWDTLYPLWVTSPKGVRLCTVQRYV